MNKTERNQTTEESIFPQNSDCHSPPKTTTLPPSAVLWRESPTSLTRDRAPAHRIPKAQRFCSTKLDLLKYQQLQSLQMIREGQRDAGISFPRSTRPEHFAKKNATPSPADYHFHRLMDSAGRARTEKSVSSTPSRSDIRGATMNHFFNYHKTYMPHAKHLPYQPQCTLDNPSPAHYTPNSTLRGREIKYSFKYALKRFKEGPGESPGPAAYCPRREERSSSFNAKGTFPRSHRTYLRVQELRSSHNHSSSGLLTS